MRNDDIDIDIDEIEAELHRVSEQKRRRDARLEELRQRRDALMEEVKDLDEEVEHIKDPSGENKDRVLLYGPEIAGTWVYSSGSITRLTPRPQ